MSTVSKMQQRLTTAYVHQIFRNLESGDGKGFFEHVAEDVDWIVEGTTRLPGTITRKLIFSHIPLTSWQRFCRMAPNCMWNIF